MGKKNIQPTTSSPVSRTLVVAPRPALEELRAEPQEGHISSLTGPDPSVEAYEAYNSGLKPDDGTQWGNCMAFDDGMGWGYVGYWYTSYDGDDE